MEEHEKLVTEWENSSQFLYTEHIVDYKVAERMYQKKVTAYEKALDIETLIEEEIERWRKGKSWKNQEISGAESFGSPSEGIGEEVDTEDIEDVERMSV